MAFATQADFETTFGPVVSLEIADFDASGAVDVARVQAALDAATDFAASYLRAWWPSLALAELALTLPANLGVSSQLRQVVVDVAAYRLRAARNVLTDDARESHRNALAWLQSVADGKVALFAADVQEPPAVLFDSNARVWGRSAGRVL